MKELPAFRPRKRESAEAFAARALTHEGRPDAQTHLRRFIVFDDGHFRAVFDPTYFTLTEGQVAPSKSQWNTFKKRLKRLDPSVFVFKEHGETRCVPSETRPCLYIDFGFLEGDRFAE